MSDLDLYRAGRLAVRDARAVSRGVSRRQAVKTLREAEIDLETDVAMTKMENLTIATGAAMTSVVRVTKAQEALEQQAPAAAARLNYLADAHAFQMAEVQSDLQRRTRRI